MATSMYRFVNQLVQPYTLAYLFTVAGLVWVWYRRRGQRRELWLIAIPLLALGVVSSPIVNYFWTGTLLNGVSSIEALPADTQAIVVLAGGGLPAGPKGQPATVAPDTLFRCAEAAILYGTGPHCPVLVSGGIVDPIEESAPVGELMRQCLLQMGVADEDIVVENESRTTYENARQCAKLLAQRKLQQIALVTDARHMTRAARCFEAQGIRVTPAPCLDRRTFFRLEPGSLLPSAKAATNIESTWHEWLGLVWYRLHGRIESF